MVFIARRPRACQGIPDTDVLAHAISLGRAVLTNNGWDFQRCHRQSPNHAGVITFTDDPDNQALADRIHAAILANEPLAGKLIRVIRPP